MLVIPAKAVRVWQQDEHACIMACECLCCTEGMSHQQRWWWRSAYHLNFNIQVQRPGTSCIVVKQVLGDSSPQHPLSPREPRASGEHQPSLLRRLSGGIVSPPTSPTVLPTVTVQPHVNVIMHATGDI